MRENATLQDILEQRDYQYLRAIEQEVLLDIALDHAVISTGGSVVYSEQVMQRLQEAGPVVYLEAELTLLQQRVAAAPLRGIASDQQQSYAEIFAERTPLYRRYADISVDAGSGGADTVAAGILRIINGED